MTYQEILPSLTQSYNQGAEYRDKLPTFPWKLQERSTFLKRIQSENKKQFFEIGAGAGHDSLFFQEAGLEVTCVDLSEEMVKRCQLKGLNAYQADFLNLNQNDQSFDILYAMNCLLHVPTPTLPEVLKILSQLLVPGGLFFLGTYGGEFEGLLPDDSHIPPRYFAFRSNEAMKRFVEVDFEILDFHVVELEKNDFQAITLRKPG